MKKIKLFDLLVQLYNQCREIRAYKEKGKIDNNDKTFIDKNEDLD